MARRSPCSSLAFPKQMLWSSGDLPCSQLKLFLFLKCLLTVLATVLTFLRDPDGKRETQISVLNNGRVFPKAQQSTGEVLAGTHTSLR